MAYNSAGPGPESERFLERTFKLRPQKPPTAVQVFGINPSTVRVTWRYVAPTVKEEPLEGYYVRYWESDKDISEANNTRILIGNKLEATINDLTPGNTYFLRVLAYSQVRGKNKTYILRERQSFAYFCRVARERCPPRRGSSRWGIRRR